MYLKSTVSFTDTTHSRDPGLFPEESMYVICGRQRGKWDKFPSE
jgi:hypothetical protein